MLRRAGAAAAAFAAAAAGAGVGSAWEPDPAQVAFLRQHDSCGAACAVPPAAPRSSGPPPTTTNTTLRLGSPDCDTFHDCDACASAKSWNGDHCRWCPRTADCHAYGSTYNKCSTEEQVDDASKCAALYTAEQVHIAVAGADAAGDPAGMTVSWYTGQLVKSVVQYGTAPDALTSTASAPAAARQYLSGYHHHVELPGLAHGARYWYRAGSGAAAEWSPVFSFSAAPASGAAFSVSVFGDMGWLGSDARPLSGVVPEAGGLVKKWDATQTRARLEALKDAGDVDLVWHVGDIGYADDSFAHSPLSFTYDQCYNGFMNWQQNISATRPYMVSPGNHESECHSPACLIGTQSSAGPALANFTAFNNRWRMPSEPSGGVLNMWYSYNYGAAHMVSINTETDFAGAGEETKGDSGLYPAGGFAAQGAYLAWLEADLKAADDARRSNAPGARKWIFAGGHRPCCEAGSVGPGVWELFQKYGVDAYFAGHAHSYLRRSQNGTLIVVVGGAGCDEMPFGERVPPAPNAETYATAEIATGLLRVDGGSARWQLVASSDGAIIDDVTLTR